MTQENQFDIENVGPIARLAIPIPEGGGVVVLRGRNGAGKSTALASIQSAMSDKGPRVHASDGQKRGTVDGFGARLTVGRSLRRTGEMEVDHLEGRLSIAALVDPGLKGAEASDNARIRALVALQGIQTDPEAFAKLAKDADEFDTVMSGQALDADVVTAAGAVRRAFHAQARRLEDKANADMAAADAIIKETEADLDAIPATDVDPGGALVKAAEELAAIATMRDAYVEAVDAAQRATATLNTTTPPANIEAMQAAEDTARAAFDAAAEAEAEAAAALEEAQRAMAAATDATMVAHKQLDAAKAETTAARAASAEWIRLTGVVEALHDVPRVTDTEVEEAKAKTERLGTAAANASKRAELSERLTANKAKRADASDTLKDAERLRDAARATDDVLAAAIKAGSLTVEAGRLVFSHATRGVVPYSELSEGERWTIAIEIAAEYLAETGGVLVVEQGAWEGLDPDNREHVDAECKRCGVVLLTAEATDGPLRVEAAQ